MEHDSPDLGMDKPITRRDFISGVAAAGVAAAGITAVAEAQARTSAASAAAPMDASPTDASPTDASPTDAAPPAITGLRGQYPGSFEMAHAARDGRLPSLPTGEVESTPYDLIVVGGGISGLAAAHFFRRALGADCRILILDNHDDFGGHAKRNEFHHQGRLYLGYGGTMSIETPFPYSYTAKALLIELGIDSSRFADYENRSLYAGLDNAVFFDREHFAADKLVGGVGRRPWSDFFASAPLSAEVRADLVRIHTESVDYLPDLDPAAKAAALKRMSYETFLLKHAGLHASSLAFFAGEGFRNNMRVDTCPAFVAARSGAAGFKGMKIDLGDVFESDVFHFPDGNATIARLLVSRLVPDVFPGPQTPASIVASPADYAKLDLPANPTRIRLKSTVVGVKHEGMAPTATMAGVTYIRDGRRCDARAGNVVMACFNNIIPFIVADLPEDQQTALRYASKVPMLYTNVLVRNWEPWRKLGVKSIQAPNGFHTRVSLDIPVSMGAYQFPDDPHQAIVVHMVRNPNRPGVDRKSQNRAGRAEMLAMPFDEIEKEIRLQLNRMLGPAGFDAGRDILAITANRWPHGYAYTYDTLGDPELPDAARPHVIGRRLFGRIAIANADSGAAAFTNVAIDQAERAVQDCLISRGLV